MNLNQDVTAPPIERPREKPVGVFEVGVLYPIFVAGLSGFLVAGLVLLAVWIIDEAVADFSLSKKTYLIIFLVTFSLVTTLVWKDFVERGWWAIEEMVRRDLNGDGVIGEPPAARYSYEVKLGDNQLVTIGDLTIPEQEMVKVARGVLSGALNLSVNSLRHPDAPELIRQMCERGMATRPHVKQPAVLTRGGRRWFEDLAGRS